MVDGARSGWTTVVDVDVLGLVLEVRAFVAGTFVVVDVPGPVLPVLPVSPVSPLLPVFPLLPAAPGALVLGLAVEGGAVTTGSGA
jgi:hypothetical protein